MRANARPNAISFTYAVLIALLIDTAPAQTQQESGSAFQKWLQRDRHEMKSWREGQRGRDSSRSPASRGTAAEGTQKSGFLTSPSSWAIVGAEYSYVPQLVTHTDDTAFRLAQSPDTMHIVTNTGDITWTPAESDVGAAEVELIAESPTATNRQAFTVSVSRFVTAASGVISTNGGTLTGGDCTVSVPAAAARRGLDVALDATSHTLPAGAIHGVKTFGAMHAVRVRAADGGTLRKADIEDVRISFRLDPASLPEGIAPDQVKLFGFDPANMGQAYPLESDRSTSRVTPVDGALYVGIGLVVAPVVLVVGSEILEVATQNTLYTEVYNDGYVQVMYRTSLITDRAAADAYGVAIAKSINKAKAEAVTLGFTTPSSVEVMVAESSGSEHGSYVSYNEVIYIKPGLKGSELDTAPAHEFFHAIQDEYYLMGQAAAATLGSSTSDVYWWTEASAVWFASHLFPAGSKSCIMASLAPLPREKKYPGYLRAPLMSTIQRGAYSKGSFVQYAVKQKGTPFVHDVMDASSGSTSVESAINAVFPLNENYKHYVNWSLDEYGDFSSAGDGFRLETKLADITYWSVPAAYIPATKRSINIVAIGNEKNVVVEGFEDSSGDDPYVAYVHKIQCAQSFKSSPGKVVDVKFERSGPDARDEPFVLLQPKNPKAPMVVGAPGVGDFKRLPRIGQSATDKYTEAWLVYTDTSSGAGGHYKWNVQVRDLPPLAGPWFNGLPPSQNAPANILLLPARSTTSGLRLIELKINGEPLADYAQFAEWAKQWLRDEISEGDEGAGEGVVTSILDGIASGISADLMVAVIPVMKMLYDGVPFALATEVLDGDLYLPFVPGMPEEELQALRTNEKRPPLQSLDGKSLSGTWDMSDDDDETTATLEWHIALVDGNPDVIDYSLKYVTPDLEPKNDSENAIHSFSASMEGQLHYQNLPHGEIAQDQKYLDTLKGLLMQRLTAAKEETDAVFKPFVESLKEQQTPPASSGPPPA